ncbi:TPA: 50S ribosomal protein L31 [Patescibacteria group bacterium]|nr:50S ribosomal protein L31 [Patescibacteria group bacterium]
MKKDTHPTYYPKAKVTCACGNTFETGSTLEQISTEVCSACHPLYTGKQKFIDKAGRVEKFRERAAKSLWVRGQGPAAAAKKTSSKKAKPAK